MDKSECLKRAFESADLYKRNLLNKHILILFQESPNKIGSIEVTFTSANFLHLTGILFTKGNELSPADFFTHCVERRLSIDSIDLKPDGTTEQKMTVLPLLLTPNLSAKMLGTYKGGRIKLVTDRLAGGIAGSIGFVEDAGFYHPNTVLKGDIRDSIDKPMRVMAVFRKDVLSDRYEECTYIAKKVDLNKLPIPDKFKYLTESSN